MKRALKKTRPAFTLIEIMVATAISIVLVLGVVQIASSSMTAYNNAMSLVGTTATSRLVLDTLESDIQSAILKNDGSVWIECFDDATNPTATGNYDVGAHKTLAFFSTPQDRDLFDPSTTGSQRVPYKGNVCAVRYRLANAAPLPAGLSSDDKAYCLYRSLVNSEKTYTDILLKTTDPQLSAVASTSYWNNVGSQAADIFGMNVVGMTPIFIFKKTDASKSPSTWYFCAIPDSPDNRDAYANALKDGFGTATSSTAGAPLYFSNLVISGGKYKVTASKPTATDWDDGTLVAVIVSITVLDDTGADLARVRGGANADQWKKIVQEHGKVFVRRINLPGA